MDIKEIILRTASLHETADFYGQKLGFKQVYRDAATLKYAAGTSILSFTEDVNCGQPVYHFAFNIPENQLEQAIAWADGKLNLIPVTAESVVAGFEHWNADAIYFYDNNGNLLEFIARHDLENISTVRFSAGSVLCISEIGIVCEAVSSFADELMDNYQLPVFSKQPRQDNFTVMGDDHGLLILVEQGRNWFPSKVPAGRFPMEIYLDDHICIPVETK